MCDGYNWYVYVSNNPLIYIDPTGYWKEGDNNLSEATQIIINGTNKDGKGGLSLLWELAENQYDRNYIERAADDLRGLDQSNYNFSNVYYIIDKVAANGAGHTALLIVKENGEGVYFSFGVPREIDGLSSIIGNSATMQISVMSEYNVKNVLSGNSPYVIGYYSYEGRCIQYGGITSFQYTNNVKIKVDQEHGYASYLEAAKIFSNPGRYSNVAHNCNDVALDIINANGKGSEVTRVMSIIPKIGFNYMKQLYPLVHSNAR